MYHDRYETDEIPAFLARKEPAAVYMWTSARRLIVSKGDVVIDLDAADLRTLARFVEACAVEAQL